MKIFIGKVISTKMAKTATVEVERIIAHPIYKKRIKKTRLFHVHDEQGVAKVGELVRFKASRPYSKLKKWDLVTDSAKSEAKLEVKKEKVSTKTSTPAKKVVKKSATGRKK